jgi:hypothetical protein
MARAAKIVKSVGPTREAWPRAWDIGSVIQGGSYHSKSSDEKDEALVWLSRERLSEEQRRRFHEHSERLLKIIKIQDADFGVDSEGYAFVALPDTVGKSIASDRSSPVILRNRYLRCLALISRLHSKSVSCGNISTASFVLAESGEVEFVGFLGGFESSSLVNISQESRRYIRGGDKHPGKPSAAADVFALAILGLELFGAKFGSSEVQADQIEECIEQIPDDSPPWVFSVLATIAKDPNHTLCRDAKELLKSIEVGEGEWLLQQRSAKRGAVLGPGEERPLTFDQLRELQLSAAERLRRQFDQIAESKIVKGILFTLALVLMMPFILEQVLNSGKSNPEREVVDNIQDERERQSVEDASKELVDILNQFKEAREKYVPVGGSTIDSLRESAKTIGHLSGELAGLLKYLANRNANEESGELTFKVYTKGDDESRAVLSAGFIEAGGEWEKRYREQLISNIVSSGLAERSYLESLNTEVLFLAAETRLSTEAAHFWGREDMISSDRLWWLLQAHSRKRTPVIPYLAKSIYDRKLVSWPKDIFIQTMTEARTESSPPYEAIFKAAKEGASISDVNAIAGWNDPLALRCLYAVSLATSDHAVMSRAVQGLILQPVFDAPPRPILEYLRSAQDEELWRYAKIVGGLGLNSAETDPFIADGLRDLREEPSFGTIVTTLIDHGSPRAVRALLRVYGGVTHPDRLIKLLSHSDPAVRREVLPFLKQVRITSSKEKIRDMYDNEQDPEVREVYEKELFQGRLGVTAWLSADSSSSAINKAGLIDH